MCDYFVGKIIEDIEELENFLCKKYKTDINGLWANLVEANKRGDFKEMSSEKLWDSLSLFPDNIHLVP